MASNVISLRPRRANQAPAYAPGVTPFDRSNPAHVQAWNALFALGWAEQRFRKVERPERIASLECVK